MPLGLVTPELPGTPVPAPLDVPLLPLPLPMPLLLEPLPEPLLSGMLPPEVPYPDEPLPYPPELPVPLEPPMPLELSGDVLELPLLPEEPDDPLP